MITKKGGKNTREKSRKRKKNTEKMKTEKEETDLSLQSPISLIIKHIVTPFSPSPFGNVCL